MTAGLRSSNATEVDDRIESEFRKTYIYETYLKDDAVRAKVREGVFTLTGQVNEVGHKYLAQEAAASLNGVKTVINSLLVKQEGTEKSDSWIKAKVQSILTFHRNVSGRNIEVLVKDGALTLQGLASSEAQRDLATEYASDVDGVVSVTNRMTVTSGTEPVSQVATKIDDASITAQIKTAFLLHRSTSSVGTMVVTREGAVTLSGIAKNAAEKVLVTKLATDIRGVTGVINIMTIENE